MTDPSWEVEQDGAWYLVRARATCPRCGAELSYEDRRRVVAGVPETPQLTVTVTGDAAVELSAEGLFIPLVVHRCHAAAPAL